MKKVFMLLLAVVIFSLSLTLTAAALEAVIGEVSVDKASIYKRASVNSGVVAVVYGGERLEIIGQSDSWWRVRVGDGDGGIPKKNVRLVFDDSVNDFVEGLDKPRATPKATPRAVPKITPMPRKYDFRKVRWGMTPQEVVKSETAEPTSVNANGIHYKSVPDSGYDVDLEYNFTNGKLDLVMYSAVSSFDDYESKVKEYSNWVKTFAKQYGEGSDNGRYCRYHETRACVSEDCFNKGQAAYTSSFGADTTLALLSFSADEDGVATFYVIICPQ